MGFVSETRNKAGWDEKVADGGPETAPGGFDVAPARVPLLRIWLVGMRRRRRDALDVRNAPSSPRQTRIERLYAPAREDFMVILDASLAGMKAEPPTALTGARAGAPMRATGARAAPDTARLAMDMVREAAIVPGAVSGRDE
jgi:hypothetical protein